MEKWRTSEMKISKQYFSYTSNNIYSRNTHDDASASWYTPQSGVTVPQLILTEAITDPKEIIWAAG